MRWPGVTRAGHVDTDHMVSTLDFTPTLLDATGLPPLSQVDGRSFLPAIQGERMPGWDRVFTFYNQSSGRNWLLMRCIRTRDRAYIGNAGSDGQTWYRAENMNGLSWRTMVKAGATNPAIHQRVDHYLYRTRRPRCSSFRASRCRSGCGCAPAPRRAEAARAGKESAPRHR